MPRGKVRERGRRARLRACGGPRQTIVRVKSGNGTVNGEQVSWLVGALETGGRQYVFASRARGRGRAGHHVGRRSRVARAEHARSGGALAGRAAAHTRPRRALGAGQAGVRGLCAERESRAREDRAVNRRNRRCTRARAAEKLAISPLYDYVFLNLEERYDAAAVKAMADGLRSPTRPAAKALIVRIPPIDKDAAAAAKTRV